MPTELLQRQLLKTIYLQILKLPLFFSDNLTVSWSVFLAAPADSLRLQKLENSLADL